MQQPNRRVIFIALGLALAYIAFSAIMRLRDAAQPDFGDSFDGQRAYADVQTQVAFGARTPGSEAHRQTVDLSLQLLTMTCRSGTRMWARFSRSNWSAEEPKLNLIVYD